MDINKHKKPGYRVLFDSISGLNIGIIPKRIKKRTGHSMSGYMKKIYTIFSKCLSSFYTSVSLITTLPYFLNRLSIIVYDSFSA